MKYYLLVTLGSLIHLGFKLNYAVKRKDFKLSIFIKKNLLSTILALSCGYTIIYLRDEITSWLSFFKINGIIAVVLGYFGDSIFKNVMKTGKEKLKIK